MATIGSPRRILVICTRRIGDVLLTTPLIHSLKQAWPSCAIDVLVFKNTKAAVKHNPDINTILTIAERPSLGEHLRLLGRLWRKYDLAVSPLVGDRPTLYAYIAGRYRIGLLDDLPKNRWKRRLLSCWVPFDGLHTHTVLMNLQLAVALGIPQHPQVVVGWHPDDPAYVHQQVACLQEGSVALLHVMPKYAYKQWSRQAWIDLAFRLRQRGFRIFLSGGNDANEKAYIEGLMPEMPDGTQNLAGRLTLSQVTYLISQAAVYIGPDTATTHIAAALGVPTVALFGPSNPVKWGPWPTDWPTENPYLRVGSQRRGNVALLQGTGACVPCMEEGCDRHLGSLSQCLQTLSVTQVLAAVDELLSKPSPFPAQSKQDLTFAKREQPFKPED